MASRSKLFATAAAKAAVSAIALYNQPRNDYREDAFCILAVNAWELLLKAKIIKDNKNKIESIYAYSKVKGRKKLKRNRTGAATTVGILKCIELINQQPHQIDQNIKGNLEVLIELRDNAVHFINRDPTLADRVFRIGTASLINFFKLYESWFGATKELRFVPLPLAFNSQNVSELNAPKKSDLKKIVEFVDSKISREQKSDYAIAVQMQIKFVKDRKGDGTAVRITNDPNAPEVRLTEQDFQDRFPLDYKTLMKRAKEVLPGLKTNNNFSAIVKELRDDPNLCHTRYLDPKARKGLKRFYSEALIARLMREKSRLNFHAV